jgi:putative addiction module component (TIGR02574 family)
MVEKRAGVNGILPALHIEERFAMPVEGLMEQAMALPMEERVRLVEALWQSIHDDLPDDESADIATALRRDAELSSGAVQGRSHEEVMRNARIESFN